MRARPGRPAAAQVVEEAPVVPGPVAAVPVVAAVLGVAFVLLAGCAGAGAPRQAAPETTPAAARDATAPDTSGTPGTQAAPPVAVVGDPEATALAVAVVTPGSAWELPGTNGLTVLSAMTVLEEVRPRLAALDARAEVTCSAATFTFTLVAPRDAADGALNVFLDGLFRPTPGPAALDRARRRLHASLMLDQASPAWQARLAVRRALHNDTLSSGWLGPSCGVPETLALFDLADVRAAALRFAPRLAVAAAIAPDAAAVRSELEARLPHGPRYIPTPRMVTTNRVYVERNTVTAWLAVAFPFDASADLEAIRLLGAVLEDAIAPGVARPASFSAGYEVERHGRGGALVVRAVTSPDEALDYEDRIEALVARIAWGGVPPTVLERVARRHRGERLMALATPESRAAGMALALAYGHDPEPWPELRVAPSRLQAAAAALAPPARSVVGPRAARGPTPP